jgi:glycerophosphoryl diester phosphodiesterase
MRFSVISITLHIAFLSLLHLCGQAQSVWQELSRYQAPNATQAVAADSEFFYTISNSTIVKHSQETGEELARWRGPLKHLNSGAIIDGKLYCANSNYPQVPMASSLEIFDCKTLRHIGSHSFGHYIGSFTWIDRIGEDDYLLMFVHYENQAQERGKGVGYTTLIRTDNQFRRKGGWILPKSLVDYLKPTSISGGIVLSEHTLLLSPHHNEEVYLFNIPDYGYELEWIETIPVPFQGQGLALDHSGNTLWGMRRDTREVIEISMVISPVPALLKALQAPMNPNALVVAHRGDWRHAPENSLQAIKNSIDMGADMVEIDVRLTKDGIPVLMHDETIDRTTTGKGKVSEWTLSDLKTLNLRNGANHPTHHTIPTLEEAMIIAKGKILVNLDKCYGFFDNIYPILESTGTTHQVLMKGKVTWEECQKDFGPRLNDIMFMPIIDLEDPNAEAIINAYQTHLHPVAYEMIFRNTENPLLSKFSTIRESGSHIWVNTLWESLNAGYEDDAALENPEKIYGWLLDKGVTIFQTDRPEFLINYLRENKLK